MRIKRYIPKLKLPILLLLLVGAILILSQFKTFQLTNSQTVSKSDLALSAFIADAILSPASQVESKIIAEKLNLERKLIIPKSASQVDKIQSAIKERGGKIIRSKSNLIVAMLPKETEENIMKELEAEKAVTSLEVDYPTFLAADTPDWGVTKIEAPAVWPTTQASGIKIAVIDTGIDYTHPELKSRYGGGYDTYNEDSDPFDDNGHGTHVSGTIASEMNDSSLVGVSPKVSIIAVKALGANGTGYISNVVEAIDWAMGQGVQVMNFSLGSSQDSLALRSKITEASNKGIHLVAAAGNNYGGPLLYPAAYSNVISVSATNSSDQFASFSSLGAEIAAPGVAITSTIPGGGVATWSGTSMAAPHATATIALMIANKQSNIREALHNTAIDLGPTGKDSYFGYGRVNAKTAALGKDTLAPVVTFIAPGNNSKVSGQVKIEITAQDEHIVTEVKLLIDNQLVKTWSQGPYTYLWDTTSLTQKDYLLLAEALDNSGNMGSAKITVTVSTTLPTPSPTRSPIATPSAQPSPYPQRGGSEEHRQDIYGPAEEHRQNYPNWPEQKSKEAVSEVTNINSRNPKPQNNNPPQSEEKSQSSKQDKDKQKGKVKGVQRILFFIPR